MKYFCTSILVWMLAMLAALPLRAANDPLMQLNTGGPTAATRSILLNSDESLLVAAGDDKVVRVWDTVTEQQVRQIRGQVSDDIEGAITSMALSPDDRWLAVAIFYPHQSGGIEKRGYLRIHDFATGDLIKNLEGHTKVLSTLVFSNDGSMLLGGETLQDSPKAIIWDTTSWQVKQQFLGHKASVRSATFTPDHSQIITASWDESIKVWDVKTGKNVKTINNAHDGRIYSIVAPPGASEPIAITGGTDKTIKIWNYKTGKNIRTIKFDRKIRQVIANDSGTRLLAASVGEHINSWIAVINTKNGKTLTKYKGHDRFSMAMVLSGDGDTVYSGGGFKHEIDRWSLSSNQQTQRIVGAGMPVQAVGISHDGNTIYWGHTPIDWSGKKYNIDKLARLSNKIELSTIHGQLGVPREFNKGASKVSRTVRKSGKLTLKRIRPNKGGFFSILEIRRSGKVVGKVERNKRTGHVHTAYTFTPDGKAVITGGEIGYLSIHGLNGKKLGDFKGHSGDITDLAVSKDGTLLVSGSRDQTFKIWNLQSRELLLSFFVANNGEWIAWCLPVITLLLPTEIGTSVGF
ncbi:MAG: WD40 repeat domain-containing protein [bacterium]